MKDFAVVSVRKPWAAQFLPQYNTVLQKAAKVVIIT